MFLINLIIDIYYTFIQLHTRCTKAYNNALSSISDGNFVKFGIYDIKNHQYTELYNYYTLSGLFKLSLSNRFRLLHDNMISVHNSGYICIGTRYHDNDPFSLPLCMHPVANDIQHVIMTHKHELRADKPKYHTLRPPGFVYFFINDSAIDVTNIMNKYLHILKEDIGLPIGKVVHMILSFEGKSMYDYELCNGNITFLTDETSKEYIFKGNDRVDFKKYGGNLFK